MKFYFFKTQHTEQIIQPQLHATHVLMLVGELLCVEWILYCLQCTVLAFMILNLHQH